MVRPHVFALTGAVAAAMLAIDLGACSTESGSPAPLSCRLGGACSPTQVCTGGIVGCESNCQCASGTWQAPCPAEVPRNGDSCTGEGSTCGYLTQAIACGGSVDCYCRGGSVGLRAYLRHSAGRWPRRRRLHRVGRRVPELQRGLRGAGSPELRRRLSGRAVLLPVERRRLRSAQRDDIRVPSPARGWIDLHEQRAHPFGRSRLRSSGASQRQRRIVSRRLQGHVPGVQQRACPLLHVPDRQ
jgi:hypothetical protein